MPPNVFHRGLIGYPHKETSKHGTRTCPSLLFKKTIISNNYTLCASKMLFDSMNGEKKRSRKN